MKKIFTLLTLAAAATVMASAQSLYSTEFAEQSDFDTWTVVDVNADGSTWEFSTSDSGNVSYRYNSTNAGDDWFISPEIVPAKTGTVAVLYTYYGSFYGESMDVHVGTGTTPDGYGTALAQHTNILSQDYNNYILIDATEGVAFRVAFHATSGADLYTLHLKSVAAKHIEQPMDLGVTEVISPATGECLGEESVTVKVKNFGESDASNFDIAYQVDDKEAVVETFTGILAAGAEAEFTFTAKVDLSASNTLFNIKVYTAHAEDLNPTNDAAIAQVFNQTPVVLPFSTEFGSEADFNLWSKYDVNGDGSTWVYDAKVYYNYNGSNNGDDWLISPQFTALKTGTIAVIYSYTGSSYAESMDVHIGTGSTPDDFGEAAASHPEILGDTYSSYVLVDVVEGQTFHVGFHATSHADAYRLFLSSVEVKHVDSIVDLGVTAVVSPETGLNLGEETVTVMVKNYAPTDVSNFDISYQIGENEAVVEKYEATLAAGAEAEYTFATKVDMSTPRQSYILKVFTIHADDLNKTNDAVEVKVRHQAPAAVPYYQGFELDEVEGISYFNIAGDNGTWSNNQDSGWYAFARTGTGSLAYNYDSSNAADDWAILEPIKVEPGYYALKFWYTATEGHPERLSVHYGSTSAPEAMTTKILEINPMMNSSYNEAIVILNFETAQDVCFGFYAFSDANENWMIIDDLSFEAVDSNSKDMAVLGMTAPFEFIRSGNGADATYEIRNYGVKDVEASVELFIDGASIATQSVAIRAQEVKAVTFENAVANLAAGEHTLKVDIAAEGDENTDNNSLESKIVVLGSAAVMYDFEDAAIPEGVQYQIYDSGTVNPNAGEEFNEEGFGIFKVSTHEMLGDYVLAATSWIDGDKADRGIIFPAIDLVSEDSYLVWDANSYNPSFPERYSVSVQDNTASWPYFTTLYSQYAENITPTTRGISLAEFAGKNISFKFNIETRDGDCLILDNIAVYDGVLTGVDNVAAEAASCIMVSNGQVKAAGAEEIVLIDMLGRTVKIVEGEVLDLNEVAAGIYVAVAKNANGATATCKFAK